ncbi:Cna B-type domain-containing protein, partial [Enterococcus faecalis]|uniref:Cna B-type domain-containing protein n=1 Tax=Enterococcus faecalis TaxID=1351 RepID=UPI003D6B799C
MKKRFASYIGIFVILSSFLGSPITVLAETIQSSEQTQPTESVRLIESTDNTETKDTNSQSQISSEKLTSSTKDEKSPILTTTETDQKQASEATKTSEQQSRAPTRVKREVQENGKYLKNVITNIGLWDVANGGYVPQKDGLYQLVQDNNYRFESKFDLSTYDGNLNDNDYFTFTIPAPFTVSSTNFELRDEKSGVAVGDVEVTSQGDGRGATVKITLKNLTEYLEKTGGTQVQGVKGTFYVDFKPTKVISSETITYPSSETSSVITHTISVKKRSSSDYTERIKKENFVKNGGVMTKEDWQSDSLDKSGHYIHNWYLRVNTNQSTYDTIKLNDKIPDDSAPMQYIPEKLKIYAGYFNSNLDLTDSKLLEAGKDYIIEYNSSYTNFTLKILNTSTRLASNGNPAAYNVHYSTTSPANGTTVINELSMTGDNKDITIGTDTNRTVNRVERSTKVTTGGTIQLETGYRITLYKQDADTGDLLNGAEFEITSPIGSKELVKVEKDGVVQSKVYSSDEAGKGQFTIVETKAPPGYVINPAPIKVTVGVDGVIRTIKNTKEKVSIPVTKTWKDDNDQDGKRPNMITVNLLANGKKLASKELTEADGWQYVFENLPKYENGQEIVYTVTEDQVPEYNTEINGYDITNSYTPGKTSVSVTKAWDDNNNQDGLRPNSVQAQLYANGKAEGSPVELNEGNQWSHTWNDLPEKAKGQAIVYTVKEITQVPGYTGEVDDSNLGNVKIINTHAPEVTKIMGQKTWNDKDNQDGKRPEKINVNLLANGRVVATKEVSEADGWQYVFDNLPKYENGQEIVYTVTEDQVPEYNT